MSNMINMPWTFLVVFMAIFAVILIAAVIGLCRTVLAIGTSRRSAATAPRLP